MSENTPPVTECEGAHELGAKNSNSVQIFEPALTPKKPEFKIGFHSNAISPAETLEDRLQQYSLLHVIVRL